MTMKEFLTKPEEYDFTECTASTEYQELQKLDRFFAYMMKSKVEKKTKYENVNKKYNEYKKNRIFDGLVDPDSNCRLLRDIYKDLWEDKYPYDFTCKKESFIYGDTMNSANTIFNKFARLSPYGNSVPDKGILGVISLYYADTDFKKYLDKSKELVNFINVYHTIGNYIPVPKGVNVWKANTFNDCFDLFLAYIYNYYNASEILNRNENSNISLKGTVFKNIKGWLDEFGSWDDFVEKNYLSPFVRPGEDGKAYGKPKELWEGHFNGSALPQGENKDVNRMCNEYFKNAHDWIVARGELMVKALPKKTLEKEL